MERFEPLWFIPFLFLFTKACLYFRKDCVLIRFNLDSELLDFGLDVVSVIFGISSASVVSKMINTVLNVKSITGFARSCIELGKLGFETVTIYSVAEAVKNDLTDTLERYNEFADQYNEGKKISKAKKAKKTVYISKEVDNA